MSSNSKCLIHTDPVGNDRDGLRERGELPGISGNSVSDVSGKDANYSGLTPAEVGVATGLIVEAIDVIGNDIACERPVRVSESSLRPRWSKLIDDFAVRVEKRNTGRSVGCDL